VPFKLPHVLSIDGGGSIAAETGQAEKERLAGRRASGVALRNGAAGLLKLVSLRLK